MPTSINRLHLVHALLLFASLSCAATPSGPTFEWAPPPPEHRGRVYIYRADARNSMAKVKATLDGKDVGSFRNREYETFEISAGSHKLRAGMRGIALFSVGWNEHTFRIRPGEVVFLHLEIRLDSTSDSPIEGSRELEIGGRSDQRVSENVFIGVRPRHEAAKDLEVSTRLSSSN
jgi:hypothetical protein